MKVYGISGIGADKRVFNYLDIEFEFIPIEWSTPKKNESIKDYSKRLSEVIDTRHEFCLVGVSFGGLIATEIDQILNPKKIILISSAHTKHELPIIYKWFAKTKIIKLIPSFLFKPPKILAKYLMGSKNTRLLFEILNDTDFNFVKWALHELVTWNNTKKSSNVLRIHGTNDKLISPKGTTRMKLIQGGEHFMVVDNADEISEIINFELQKSF